MVWILIRRSASLLAAPALIALAIILARARPGWQWEWQVAINTATSVSILLSPIVAGLAAFDTTRFLSSDLDLLARGSSHGRRLSAFLALPAWICGSLALVAAVTVSMAQARRAGTPFDGYPWVTLLAITGIGAAACVGVFVGITVRHIAAAPVSVALIYIVEMVVDNKFALSIFAAGSGKAGYAGLHVDIEGCALLLLAQLGVAVGSMTLCRIRLSANSHVAPAVLMAASVILVTAVPAVSYSSTHRANFPWRATEVAYVCAGYTPQVCVAEQNVRQLPELARQMEQTAHYLTAAGASVPEVFRQETSIDADSSSWNPQEGVLTFNGTVLNADGTVPDWVSIESLSRPRMCPQYYAPYPPMALLEAQDQVREWLTSAHQLKSSNVALEKDIADLYMMLQECPDEDVDSALPQEDP